MSIYQQYDEFGARECIALAVRRLVADMSLESLMDYAEDAIFDSWRHSPWVEFVENALDVERQCPTAIAWQNGEL